MYGWSCKEKSVSVVLIFLYSFAEQNIKEISQ